MFIGPRHASLLPPPPRRRPAAAPPPQVAGACPDV
jgi:hypothetical protein